MNVLTIKEIDEKIAELQKEKRKIEEAELVDFLTLAKTNVGRCFFEQKAKKYYKIINVPQKEYCVSGSFHLNKYQYPSIVLTENEFVPVYEDTFFLRYISETNTFISDSSFKEIPEKDFNKLFISKINNFCNHIVNNEVNTK